jgi:hypothetical protein
MRIALPLAMALLTATALPSGLPASAAPLQDDEPSLVDMEADYMVLMSEADQLGRGRTIEQSIDFSTDRQGELRVQMEATEQLLRQQGANVRELGTARERFAIGEATNGFEDLAEEGAKELAEHIAEAGLSQGMKEVLGGIGLLLEVAESGAERYVQYLNTSDLLQGMRDGVILQRQILDMYSVMNAELMAEARAKRRLEEILPEQRRLFDRIAEERRRRTLPPGPAAQYAVAGAREDDALGDEALLAASLAEGASQPGPVAGDYETSYGLMRLNASGGTYPQDDGRIVVTSIAGSVMEGFWVQSRSGRECPQSRYGRHFGRIRFTFTTEGFVGVWGSCEDQPTSSWNGRRIR